MKKKDNIYLEIPIPIFNGVVILYIGEIENIDMDKITYEISNELDYVINNRDKKNFVLGTTYFFDKISFIHMKSINKNMLSVLCHEIFHAVNNILSFIGISLSDESEEVYAYTIDYVTEKIFSYLKVDVKG